MAGRRGYHDGQQVELDVGRHPVVPGAVRLDVFTPDPERCADLDVISESVELNESAATELARGLLCAVTDEDGTPFLGIALRGRLLYHDHDHEVDVEVTRNSDTPGRARLDVVTPTAERTVSLDLDVIAESIDLDKRSATTLADGLLRAVCAQRDDSLLILHNGLTPGQETFRKGGWRRQDAARRALAFPPCPSSLPRLTLRTPTPPDARTADLIADVQADRTAPAR